MANTQPTFRTFMGIARELGRTTTSAAIGNAGATTINLSDPTGFAATSKITIYDGALTEVVTSSALAGSVATVSATTNAHPNLCLVTTVGTASAGPTDYVPITTINPADDQKLLEDKAWRGSMVDTYDLILGPRDATIDIGGDLFPDTIGYILGGLLGDVVFAGGTPNTHTFAVKNSTDGQPPSYQITDFYGANCRQFGGVQFTECAIQATGDGLVTHASKATCYASGPVATPTPSYSTVRATAGWTGVTTLNSVVIDRLLSFSLTVKRAAEIISNIDGGPDPFRIFGGAVSADGQVSMVMADDTFLNYFLADTQPPLSIAWNTGTGAAQLGITLQMTKTAFKAAKINRGKSYVGLDADVSGLANTTDAGASAGYSPVKVILRNTKPAATYG